MVDDTGGWPYRRSLSEAAGIEGVRSLTVVDRLARATVWSMTFAPTSPPTQPDPAADGLDGARGVRLADDVLDTVRAVELLARAPGEAEGWFEVILIDGYHYHILRPFGPADDALVIELVLDARLTNLAAARQRFDELLPAGSGAASASPGPGDWAAEHPVDPAGLPHRTAAEPRSGAQPEPGRPVDEHILDRVAAALRTMK